MRMRCMPMPMSAKKKEKKEKKTYLEWEHADGNALRVDGLACGWSCVQMVLCADGVACGWCCMRMGCMGTWMVVAAEMVGADECKKKTKK